MSIKTLFFASLFIFSSIELSSSSTKDRLFTDLKNSFEIIAKPIRDDIVLEAGKDVVRITWMLKPSAKVDDETALKTVQVKLCYAPISQADRPWRQSHKELRKDRSCPHKIVSKPYHKNPQSLNWTIVREIPTGTYFVRAYGIDANGHEVAYGQSSDAEKTTNLFSVQGICGAHTSIDIASACFSIFSLVLLLVVFAREKKKAKLQQRN